MTPEEKELEEFEFEAERLRKAAPAVAPKAAPAAASAITPLLAPQESLFPVERTPMEQFGGGLTRSLIATGHSLKRGYQGLRGFPQSLVPGLSDQTRVNFGDLSPKEKEEETVYQKYKDQLGMGGITGEFTGDLAQAMLPTPKGALLEKALAAAAQGFALTPENREGGAAGGAAGQGVGHAIGTGLATLAKPVKYLGEKAKLLISEGVDPTLGQIMRELKGPKSLASRMEESAMSVPWVGDRIRALREGATDQARAAGRRAALPPGADANAAGTISDLGESFTTAYKQALGKEPFPMAARQGFDELGKTLEHAQKYPLMPGDAKRAGEFVSNLFEGVMPTGGIRPDVSKMDASAAQMIESRIKQKAFQYKSSQDPSQRDVGNLLHDVATDWAKTWRGAISKPAAEATAAIDSQYRKFVPLRAAAAKGNVAEPDKYTPKQLLTAIRAGDKTPTKSKFIGGNLPQQELATAMDILSPRVPDSGTTGRAAAMAVPIAMITAPYATAAAAVGGGTYSNPQFQKYLLGRLRGQDTLRNAAETATPPIEHLLRTIGIDLGGD